MTDHYLPVLITLFISLVKSNDSKDNCVWFQGDWSFPSQSPSHTYSRDDLVSSTPTAILARRGGIRYMPFLSKSQQHLTASDQRRHVSRELCYSPSVEDVSAEVKDLEWPDCEQGKAQCTHVRICVQT